MPKEFEKLKKDNCLVRKLCSYAADSMKLCGIREKTILRRE